jgi:hypothetical protein
MCISARVEQLCDGCGVLTLAPTRARVRMHVSLAHVIYFPAPRRSGHTSVAGEVMHARVTRGHDAA